MIRFFKDLGTAKAGLGIVSVIQILDHLSLPFTEQPHDSTLLDWPEFILALVFNRMVLYPWHVSRK